MSELKYSAFISYRHIEPDMSIAKKLHTMIETYGIPDAVKRSCGKKKMGRVFRDQEELPLSSDLGGDITRALEDSEWLIMICSPELLASKWCMKEIGTFIELGRKDRILTVLVHGEPQDSFPPQLLYDMTDSGLIEKEPLAADVRSGSVSGMLKRLRKEKLRLLAPMLGVTYDDLRQRGRERKLKAVLSASLAVLVLLGGFLVYAVNQNRIITGQRDEIVTQRDEIATQRDKVTEERNAALSSQSRYLADAALRAESDGDHSLAMLLALYALPDDPAKPNRPIVEEASSALYQLLLADSGVGASGGYSSVAIIKTQNEILDYVAVSKDAEERFVRVYTDEPNAYIQDYSLSTGSRADSFDNALFTTRPDHAELTRSGSVNAFYYGDRVDFIRSRDGQIYSAKLPKKDPADRDYAWTKGKSRSFWSLDYELYYHSDVTFGTNAQLLIDSEPFRIAEMNWISNSAPGSDSDEDKPVYLLGGLGAGEGDNLILWDAVERKTLRVYDIEETVHALASSDDGRYFLASCYSFDYDLQKNIGTLILGDIATGNVILTAPNDALDGSVAVEVAFPENRSKPYFSVVTEDGTFMVYDYSAMEWQTRYRPAYGEVLSASWSMSGDKLVLPCSDDVARVISADGHVEYELPFADTLENATFAADDTVVILEGFKSLQIYSAEEASSELSALRAIEDPLNSDAHSCCFSPDSSLLAIRYDGGLLTVLDTTTCEPVYSDDSGVGNMPYFYSSYAGMTLFSPDGRLLVYPISDSNSAAEDEPTTLRVVDTASWQIVGEFSPVCEYAPGKSACLNMLSMSFSGDGRQLAVYSQSGTVCLYLYDTETWEPACLRAYSENINEAYAQVQPYGEHVNIDFAVMFNQRDELVLLSRFADDYDDIVGGSATIEVFDKDTGKVLSSANIDRFDRLALRGDGGAYCYSSGTRLTVCVTDGSELYSCGLSNRVDENGLRFSTTEGFVCCSCGGSKLLVNYVDGNEEYITGNWAEWNRMNLAAMGTNEYGRVFFSETVNVNGYLNDNSRFELPINGMPMYLYRNQLINATSDSVFITLGGGYEDVKIMAVSPDGMKLCYYIEGEDDTKILCLPELSEAIRMGNAGLMGRELSEAEMRTYFIIQ